MAHSDCLRSFLDREKAPTIDSTIVTGLSLVNVNRLLTPSNEIAVCAGINSYAPLDGYDFTERLCNLYQLNGLDA